MKIIVFSDSHGDFQNMITAIKREQELDTVIHLGDGTKDFEKIKARYPNLIFHNIKGNCDWDSFEPASKRVNYQNNLIFMTHGHKFGVKQNLSALAQEGEKIGASLVLYGHTHQGQIDYLPKVILMNPGSISGSYSDPTYGTIKIVDGVLELEIVPLKEKTEVIHSNGALNYLESVDGSTNTLLLENQNQLKNCTGVYTLNQKGGRGRLGRTWEDEKGNSMALSVAYNLPVTKISAMPLIVGLSVSKVLEACFNLETGLKWSNDVLVSKKKIVGILCDSRSSAESARLVMGIGINLFQSSEYFLEKNLPYGGSLAMLGAKEINPQVLAEKIVDELKANIEEYIKTGFKGDLLKEYKTRCITLGKEILVEKNHQKQIGRAVDISEDGGLLCDFNGEKEIVYGGEVSVRGLYDYTD